MAVLTDLVNKLRNDQNPIAALQDVVLLSGLLKNASVNSQPEELTLVSPEEWQGWTGRIVDSGGERAALIAQVRIARTGEASFPGYIADYTQGSITGTRIGPAAQFCFTITMNGCTFGIGSQSGPTGTVLVSHGNASNTTAAPNNIPKGLKQETTVALQTATQYAWARDLHGQGATVIEPEHYRMNASNCTTMGYRPAGRNWEFYTQRWSKSGSVYTSMGLTLAGTNTITPHN